MKLITSEAACSTIGNAKIPKQSVQKAGHSQTCGQGKMLRCILYNPCMHIQIFVFQAPLLASHDLLLTPSSEAHRKPLYEENSPTSNLPSVQRHFHPGDIQSSPPQQQPGLVLDLITAHGPSLTADSGSQMFCCCLILMAMTQTLFYYRSHSFLDDFLIIS